MAFMAEYNRRYGIQNKKSQHVALAPLEAQWSILDQKCALGVSMYVMHI